MRVLITACRLMFNSLAARSSSSSMPDARSTFTLWIGLGIGIIMRPVLVKNRDTSLPWSARRAMDSAGIGFRDLRALFILDRRPSPPDQRFVFLAVGSCLLGKLPS